MKIKLCLIIVVALSQAPGTQASAEENSIFGRLHCNSSLKDNLVFEDGTKLIAHHHFKPGDHIVLDQKTVEESTPVATADMCMIKILTRNEVNAKENNEALPHSIGIEIWLPAYEKWSKQLHAEGGGGYAGGHASSPTKFSRSYIPLWEIVEQERAVAVHSDFGNRSNGANGSFLANQDGSPNKLMWELFSHRSIHEMAKKAKEVALAFYNEPVKYSYFRGGSTGGRQGLKIAQEYPDLFDGIIADFPAINWTKFITSELYPQIAYQQELKGKSIPVKLLNLASNSAIEFCSKKEGHDLGFVLRPDMCNYDATLDESILCSNNVSSDDCLSIKQANVLNQIWYGQTRDGNFPEPGESTGAAVNLENNQLWYGLTRGTRMDALAGPAAFPIATTQVALQMQDISIADPAIVGESGKSRWKDFSYQDLAKAYQQGITLQKSFANINTDEVDLKPFYASGGKLITSHGLADELISPMGTVNYYNRLIKHFGSVQSVQEFYRLYLIPGMSHSYDNGTSNPAADPAIPSPEFMYKLLVRWVEEGVSPNEFSIDHSEDQQIPACLYPHRHYLVSGSSKSYHNNNQIICK